MNVFISYSHHDEQTLAVFHKHLAQLKRDRIIAAWTDEKIPTGANLNAHIPDALAKAQIFIALLSPDYINSKYCYDKEFQSAIELEKQSKLIIVPVIIQPCDWLNTPFSAFKALPKDGKAISTWENENTAFLDVIQNLRILVRSPQNKSAQTIEKATVSIPRNYRVKKDFDSIEKMEFVENTFTEVKTLLRRFIEEINQLDNIKTRILNETGKTFECLLVNRNKINTESNLNFSIDTGNTGVMPLQTGEMRLNYSIGKINRPSDKTFRLQHDDFHMFWFQADYFSGTTNKKESTSKDIADAIWSEWLESVGILE